jgi:hypothetical protein
MFMQYAIARPRKMGAAAEKMRPIKPEILLQ